MLKSFVIFTVTFTSLHIETIVRVQHSAWISNYTHQKTSLCYHLSVPYISAFSLLVFNISPMSCSHSGRSIHIKAFPGGIVGHIYHTLWLHHIKCGPDVYMTMFCSSQMYIAFNSLALGRFGCRLELSIFKLLSNIFVLNISYECALSATETNWYVNTCSSTGFVWWANWAIIDPDCCHCMAPLCHIRLDMLRILFCGSYYC